ncbi:hypothetical protein [Hoeflea alexandrii]
MARKYTLFVYNTSGKQQDWTIFSEDVINEEFKIGDVRKTFTLMLRGDVMIQFRRRLHGLSESNLFLQDRCWTSKTDTPMDISFTTGPSAITVSSDFKPDD